MLRTESLSVFSPQSSVLSMTDAPQTPPKAPAAPASPPKRDVNDIKRDPLVLVPVSRDWDAVIDAKEFAGEITLIVQREKIAEVCRAFKDDGFNYLVDLSGVDYSKYPGHTGLRFGFLPPALSLRCPLLATFARSLQVAGIDPVQDRFGHELLNLVGVDVGLAAAGEADALRAGITAPATRTGAGDEPFAAVTTAEQAVEQVAACRPLAWGAHAPIELRERRRGRELVAEAR